MKAHVARAEALKALLNGTQELPLSTALSQAVVETCEALIESGSSELACEVIERALEYRSFEEPSLWVGLNVTKLRALTVLGRHADGLRLADKVSEYDQHMANASSRDRSRFEIWRSSCLWQSNQTGAALRRLDGVRAELLRLPDSLELGWCAHQMAAASLLQGNRGQARSLAMEAVVSARRAGDSYLEAVSLRTLGMIEAARARWALAVDAMQESMSISHSRGFASVHGTALRSLALVSLKRGRLTEALEHANESEAAGRISGHAVDPQLAIMIRALTFIQSGQFEKADHGLAALTSTGGAPGARAALLAIEFRGDIHLEQGQAAAALECYDEVWPRALALVPKGDIVAELRRRRAECYHLLGRFEEAHRESLAALDHCREIGDRYEEAATYRVLALSTASIGKPADAKKWFDQGFAYYDDIETPYEWGKLWLAYGDWLCGPHAGEFADAGAAVEAYGAAADHFERMGAQARLEEANARIVKATAGAPRKADAPGSAARRPRRPARRPRAVQDIDRRSDWAFETFRFITRDPAVLALLEEVAKLARSDAPILVLGESGTGKELVANGVHQLSARKGLFVPINCGAMPRDMIESELFGHVAGAFTGATRDKPGIIETCDGGTVFLDEIGEMSQDLQSRLLRFLERSEARRVGANRNYSVDTRVVAATNRDRAALERGEGFRPDLYYRLAHAVVTLPPLRRRGEDLVVLVERFMAEFCATEGREVALSDAALDRLLRHPWPGNVRQLRAVLRRAVLLGTPERAVLPEDLQLDDGIAPTTLSEELEQAERVRIEQALASAQGSKTVAARALGMPRTTLITKMQRYGMM